MQECRRCGKTAEDNVIGFLNSYALCTECFEQFKPELVCEINLFCLEEQEKLRISQFKEYARQNGWKRIRIKRKEVIRFESPRTKYVTVDIPARVGLMDYLFVLKMAVGIISTYENRGMGDVLSDIIKIKGNRRE